jgi:hypothetical protein
MPVIHFKRKSIKRNFLFIHIPKTGGTALINFFEQAGMEIYLGKENNPIVGLLHCPSLHFEYAICEKIFNIDAFDFSFGIVRNPINRAKSDYLWAFRNVKKGQRLPKFDDWVHFAIKKYRENPYFLDNHVRPQSDFIGKKIRKVYKYECGLEVALRDVLQNIGLEAMRSGGGDLIAKQNTSEQYHGIKSSEVEMSDSTHKLLCDFYSEDFERFGYSS